MSEASFFGLFSEVASPHILDEGTYGSRETFNVFDMVPNLRVALFAKVFQHRYRQKQLGLTAHSLSSFVVAMQSAVAATLRLVI